MSPLVSLGIVLLQAVFILVPFAFVALLLEWLTRGRRVEHVTCSKCLYNVEFAPSPRCQECGSELASVGVLHPKLPGGRLRRTRLFLGIYAVIALPPALVVGVAVAEYFDNMAYDRAMTKAGGAYEEVTKAINAIGPASGEYQVLYAWLQYRRGPGPFHYYEHLDIRVQLNDGARHSMTIPLDDRTIEWAGGGVILPPEIAAVNEGPHPRVLAEADIDREHVRDWLGRHGVDVERDDVRGEVDDFIDYVIANMTTETALRGVAAPPGLGAFRSVMIPIGVTVPGVGAGTIPGPIMAILMWALLMLIPLWTLQRTNVRRRRAARAWIAEQSSSAGRN